MPTILFTAPYMLPFKDRFIPILEHFGCQVLIPKVHERLNEEEILAYAGKFDATICGDDRYSSRVLDKCAPRLKVISKWGTGIDSIDKKYAESLGIKVCNTPNAFTLPVADSVLGYMLAFARLHPWMDRAMKNGEWNKIPGRSLSECTLGVVGVGNIGKAVLCRARGFGMKLLGNDIIPIPPDFLAENGVEMTDLKTLLNRSDFISINCTLNPTSLHLINEKELKLVRPNAVIINTARGPIIEETALIAALQHRKLAGAALDVFEVEPLPDDSPLKKMDNVMLAPHNSNSSPSAWERVHWNTILNLLNGLSIPHPDFEEMKNSN
jgi:D-3-phosphoglycerate dehydrogenase